MAENSPKSVAGTAFVFLAMAAVPAGVVFSQAAGDSCSAGDLSGPDANGDNLICSGGVFVVAGGGGGVPGPAPAAGSTIIRYVLNFPLATNQTSYSSTTFGSGSDLIEGRQMGVQVFIGGTIRVRLAHSRWSGGSATSFVRVLKNGTQVQEWSTTSTTSVERTVDVAVAVGDNITVQHRSSSSSVSVYLNYIFIEADNVTPAVW